MMEPDVREEETISVVKKRCHEIHAQSCIDLKRRGIHRTLLSRRPHWSVLKKEEQYRKIDLGATIPFDISLPLPAKDSRAESEEGVKLFWETFKCQHCGRCCYTPGAGLYLEKEDFDRIAERIGKKRLKALCKYDLDLKAWILHQPCPFYSFEDGCEIYSIRPQTCVKYPLHPPIKEMPYNLAVDAFCPAARQVAKDTLGWWIICENNWAEILKEMGSTNRR
jgi:Fe-S-cluster containining protein